MCPATAGPTSPADGQRRRRYPSDTTDTEWALIQPLLPAPACTRAAGDRPEAHPRREVVDAIRYLVHNGCVWRALPADFPPWRTVYGFFARWAADGTLARVHDALREQVRLQAGRNPAPSAAIIDSQSVRAADTVPKQSRGFDAAKKINGRKRHLAVDTLGLLLVVLVTAVSVQDRDGAWPLLWRLQVAQRRIRLVWADAAYAGRLVAWAAGAFGPAGRDRPSAPGPRLPGAAAPVAGGAPDRPAGPRVSANSASHLRTPQYSTRETSTWSPGSRAWKTAVAAAIPEANSAQAQPAPSSAASRASAYS